MSAELTVTVKTTDDRNVKITGHPDDVDLIVAQMKSSRSLFLWLRNNLPYVNNHLLRAALEDLCDTYERKMNNEHRPTPLHQRRPI